MLKDRVPQVLYGIGQAFRYAQNHLQNRAVEVV